MTSAAWMARPGRREPYAARTGCHIALFANGADIGKCMYCVVSDNLAFLFS